MAKRASTRPTAAVNMTARREAITTVGNDNVQEDLAIATLRARAESIFAARGVHGVKHSMGDTGLALIRR